MTKKRYFHEVIEEDEKILAIGLKQSRLHKKERLDREKAKEKTLSEMLMEGFVEEQRQRELEEEQEEHPNCGTDDCCKKC